MLTELVVGLHEDGREKDLEGKVDREGYRGPWQELVILPEMLNSLAFGVARMLICIFFFLNPSCKHQGSICLLGTVAVR